MKDEMPGLLHDLSRRDFLRIGGITAVGMSIPEMHAEAAEPHPSSVIGMTFAPVNPRIGIIGTGGRGTSLLGDLLAADAKVLALCDVVPQKAEHAQSLVV